MAAAFEIEEEGEENTEEAMESEKEVLARFVAYVKEQKIIMIDELASQFSLRAGIPHTLDLVTPKQGTQYRFEVSPFPQKPQTASSASRASSRTTPSAASSTTAGSSSTSPRTSCEKRPISSRTKAASAS